MMFNVKLFDLYFLNYILWLKDIISITNAYLLTLSTYTDLFYLDCAELWIVYNILGTLNVNTISSL